MSEIKMLKIEHGIPIPKERRGRGFHWKDLADNMIEGDSVLVQGIQANHLRHAIYRTGYVAVQRKTQEGTRVWKLGKRDK